MIPSRSSLCARALLILFIQSCGGGTEPGGIPPQVKDVHITSSMSSLAVGTSVQLAVEVRDNNGQVIAQSSVSWSSSDVTVLSVTSGGLATGVKAGTASVTATSGGKSGTLVVEVSALPVVHVIVTPALDTMVAGMSTQFSVATTSASGQPLAGRSVSWVSSDSSIATVNAAGMVHGVKHGSVTISATSEGVTGSAAITVLAAVSSITVTPSEDTLRPGQQRQLTAELRDSDGGLVTGIPVVWSSSNAATATVMSSGMVYSHEVGQATISARVEGVVGTMTLVVAPVPVTSISLQPQSITLVVGDTLHFHVVFYDSAGNELAEPVPPTSVAPTGILDPTGYKVVAQGLGDAVFTVDAGTAEASAQVGVAKVSYATVDGGVGQSCALSTNNIAFCWGQGNGSVFQGLLPSSVPGNPVFDSISTGAYFSCGLAANVASCWGINPVTFDTNPAPELVAAAPSFVDIRVGDDFACGLATDGSAHCWGRNWSGQLGDGSNVASSSPTTVAGLHTFIAIGAGRVGACGLESDGKVYCWGGLPNITIPRLVSDTVTFANITSGFCGLDAGGTAWCWGDTEATPVPTKVPGSTFLSLTARGSNSCGLQADGTAWCWLVDFSAATSIQNLTPIAVPGNRPFQLLSAGSNHTCGIGTDALLYCWGAVTAVGSTGHYAHVDEPALVAGQP